VACAVLPATSLYTSMALGEVEKVRSITKRQIVIFAILIVSTGLLFRFGFYPHVFGNFSVSSPVSSSPPPSESITPVVSSIKLLNTSKNSFPIVGIIGKHYLVNTSDGIKKVAIDPADKKNINDEIRIENYSFFKLYFIFVSLYINLLGFFQCLLHCETVRLF
jgi:hypothetical protein